MMEKLLVIIIVLYLSFGCAIKESLPDFSGRVAIENGCAFKFSSDDKVSWLSISSNGQISYKANDRKMTTDPEGSDKMVVIAKPYRNDFFVLVISGSVSGKEIPVGLIGKGDLDSAMQECHVAIG